MSEAAVGGLDGALAVEVAHLTKSYGPVRANADVSLRVRVGSIHAVVGENGAGKSTLMGVLAGAVEPDGGQIRIHDHVGAFRSQREAALAGVGMVYQEFMLAPDLSILENIVLGWERTRFGVRLRRKEREDVLELMARSGIRLPVDATVGSLSIAHRQQVEILKVLYRDARILILDEPTAVLTPHERLGLFSAMRRLRAAGATVVIVGHKLNEILEIADEITVMRSGRTIASVATADTTADELARMIVGGEIRPVAVDSRPAGEPLLEIASVWCGGRSAPRLADVTLSVHGGQITGIAGVAGSGQNELMECCAGLRALTKGTITIRANAETVTIAQPAEGSASLVRRLRRAGLAYVPQDRKDTATLADEPLWMSMVAGKVWATDYRPGGFRPSRFRSETTSLIDSAGVVASSADAFPGDLSGGNLQKFVVGRELAGLPRVVLAEDPTRGVDIGSATLIRQRLRTTAEAGAAVLLASTDLDELVQICDRIVVFLEGRIVASFDRSEVTPALLGAAMTGVDAHT